MSKSVSFLKLLLDNLMIEMSFEFYGWAWERFFINYLLLKKEAIYFSGFPISIYAFSAQSALSQLKSNHLIRGTNVKP